MYMKLIVNICTATAMPRIVVKFVQTKTSHSIKVFAVIKEVETKMMHFLRLWIVLRACDNCQD